MIYDGSTGTVSEINTADYIITKDPIFHEKSEFKLLTGWNNAHIGLGIGDPFENVLLTGTLNVNGSTSKFGHSSSTLALGTSISAPVTSATFNNFKVKLPDNAAITSPLITWFNNFNSNSTGNTGI